MITRFLIGIEKIVKKPLFNCQMCGQCVLGETALVCPMNCPKELRNGPCGGVQDDGTCEVMQDMPCVWGRAVSKSQKIKVFDNLTRLRPPINQRLRGTSSHGLYFSGKPIADMPALFLGAVENPAAPPREYRSVRALKKFNAGAGFFQLQTVFSKTVLDKFLKSCVVNGVSSCSAKLPTIFVPSSVNNLRFMENHVPGITVPSNLIQEIERFRRDGQKQACLEYSLAMAADIINMPGVAGPHVIYVQGLEVLPDFRSLIEQCDNRRVA